MSLKKAAATAEAEPGDVIIYTIWYNNTGDGNAKQVWINDTLPAGMTYVSANPTPYSQSGSLVTWYFNNIQHNDYNSLTVTARVATNAADGTFLVNQASLTYKDQLLRPMGTVRSWYNVTVRRAVITVVKTANVANVLAGGTIVYTITYNNVGSRSAGHVGINDTLSAWLTYQSANPAPTSIVGKTLSWHFTNVAPGAHSIAVTVRVSSTAPTGTQIINTATLNYTTMKNRPLPGSSSSVTVIVPEFQTFALPIFIPILVGLVGIRYGRRKRRSE